MTDLPDRPSAQPHMRDRVSEVREAAGRGRISLDDTFSIAIMGGEPRSRPRLLAR